MRIRSTFLTLSLLIACGQSPGGSPNEDDTPRPIAPTVNLLAPDSGEDTLGAGQTFSVKAQTADPDSPLSALILSLSSNHDGIILQGQPDATGLFVGEASLETAGQHSLTLKVTDPSGLFGESIIGVSVRALNAPTVVIDTLAELPQAGDSITLTALISDVEDAPETLQAAWELDGRSVTGTPPTINGNVTFTTTELDAGNHAATLTIKDSDGLKTSDTLNFVVENCPDNDRDGYTACPRDPEDCDDENRDINPGERELCDEVDHDCDGDFYNDLPDTDRDGVIDCLDPCPDDRQDDTDEDGVCQIEDNCPRDANPDQIDTDGDGIGDLCDPNPGEQCDGIDNDQDGQTDEGFDNDGDGIPTCSRGPFPADCDDDNADVYPNQEESCDGIDNNCDGNLDETFPDSDGDAQADCVDVCPQDLDNDADEDGICGDVDNCPDVTNAGQLDGDDDGLGDLCDDITTELCDGIDNDLDGEIDENLATQDSDLDGAIDCDDACPFDADNDGDDDGFCGDVDTCPDVPNSDQADIDGNGIGDACDLEFCDGLDNDADGQTDEGFDQDMDGAYTCDRIAEDGSLIPADCNDVDATIHPNAEEICDGIDHNCNGETEDGFEDDDGDGIPTCRDLCPMDLYNDVDEDGVCGDIDNCPEIPNTDQADIDVDEIGDACDLENTEICDGIDNDADGQIDEDEAFQVDDDGDGILNCVDLCPDSTENDPDDDGICEVVDNCPGLYNPDQIDVDESGVGDRCEPELCDGIDNDLDGLTDEDFDEDGDGYPTCAVGDTPADCDDQNNYQYPGPEEICGDLKDNNCDGYIDRIIDDFEPNDFPGDAHDLGLFDNNEIHLYGTIGGETAPDRGDFFEFSVIDDDGPAPDVFQIDVQLTDIPEALELELILYYGLVPIAQSENPGNGDQSIHFEGRNGVDDGLLSYLVEVRYLSGDAIQGCGPYHLYLSNDG